MTTKPAAIEIPGQNALRRSFIFMGLMVLTYVILQPNIFGPKTNMFAAGMEQHALLVPLLRHVQEFAEWGNPIVRWWYAEFDIHHNPHMNGRYPFYFTWLGEPGNFEDTNRRIFLITHFHHLIGGLGAFVFARCLGVKPLSAFAAGLFFALCLNNTYLAPFFTRMAASAWTPWGLAAVWLAATGKNPWLAIFMGVPSVAMMAFASSAQPLLYFVIASVFVGSAGLYYAYKRLGHWGELLKTCLLPSFVLAVLSLALALPATLPVFLEQSEYVRWTNMGPVDGSFRVPFEETLMQPFDVMTGLTNPFVPGVKDHNVGTSFLGPVFGFLILATCLTRKLRLLAAILLGLSIYFMINGMGTSTFLPRVSYQIPLLGNVRQLTSHYVLINFAAIALIGICWDFLSENNIKYRIPILITAVLVMIVTALTITYRESALDPLSPLVLFALFLGPCLIMTLTFIRSDRVKSALLIAIAVAMVFPSAHLRKKAVFNLDQSRYYTETIPANVLASWETIAAQEKNAVVAVEINGKFRNGKAINTTRVAATAVYFGLRPYNSNMSPRPKDSALHFKSLAAMPEKMAKRGLQYLVTDNKTDKPDPEYFEYMQSHGPMDIYKVRAPKGRLNRMCDLFPGKNGCRDLEYALTDTQETNTRFDYTVALSRPEQLIFYGYKKEHWSGTLNGEPIELKWRGKDQIQFLVPAGENKINFVYEDQRQKKLWWVFWAGLIGFTLALIFYRPNKTKRLKLASSSSSE